ncbi:MAG: thioredoxin [Bacilli bacterium]|nr:thioredoxin [Bacilli bacterium]
MSLINFNEENFNELIKEGTVLVDFYADWCGPCKMLGPVLTQFSEMHKDITVVKVNVDVHQELASQYGVMSIPKLILFKDGAILATKNGFQSIDMLNNWIEESK